jgi:uncharacterized protein (TIGR02453 family)
MNEGKAFQGFTKETIAFFRGLKKNNTREWFESHREVYDHHVMEPAKAFVVAMGARLREISPRITSIPRINKSIFRLNRDVRFSSDKSPYKPNLGIYFWEGLRSRMECPGFYFHIEPPILLLGAGFYMIPDWLIERYRHAVVHPQIGKELSRIVADIKKRGEFKLEGKHYKRIPAGFAVSHPNADLLLHNGLYAGRETAIPDEFFSPALVDYCFDKFRPFAALHHWLVALMQRPLLR